MGRYLGRQLGQPQSSSIDEDEQRRRMLHLQGQSPTPGQSPGEYVAGAAKGFVDFLGRLAPITTGVAETISAPIRAAKQGRLPSKGEMFEAGVKRPFESSLGGIVPGTKQAPMTGLGEPIRALAGEENLDYPLAVLPGVGKITPRKAAAVADLFAVESLIRGLPQTPKGIAAEIGAGREIAAGTAAAKEAGRKATEEALESLAKPELEQVLRARKTRIMTKAIRSGSQADMMESAATARRSATISGMASGINAQRLARKATIDAIAEDIRNRAGLAGLPPDAIEEAIQQATTGKAKVQRSIEALQSIRRPQLEHGYFPLSAPDVPVARTYPPAADPAVAGKRIARDLQRIRGMSVSGIERESRSMASATARAMVRAGKDAERISAMRGRAKEIANVAEQIEVAPSGSSFRQLKVASPKAAATVGRIARNRGAEAQADAIKTLYENVGEAANLGEAAKRGEVAAASFKIPFGRTLYLHPRLSEPIVRGVSAIQRGGQQALSAFGLAEPIGGGRQVPGAPKGISGAFMTGLRGERMPGEIGKTGRQFSQAIGRQRAGEASVLSNEARERLHGIFIAGGGTTAEERDMIRRALDEPDLAKQMEGLKHEEAKALQNAQIEALPEPLMREKAQRVVAYLDYLRSQERLSGLPVKERDFYFPRRAGPEYKGVKGAMEPQEFTFGRKSGIRQPFNQERTLLGNMDEANAWSQQEYGVDIFPRKTVENLWLRGLESANARAAVRSYDKFLGQFARPIQNISELRPGETAVIPPGAMRELMAKITNVSEGEAKRILDVVIDGGPTSFLGTHPTPRVAEHLQGIPGLKRYAVSADVAKDMGLYVRRIAEESDQLPGFYKRLLNLWKQETILPFPAYHVTNYLGNWTNAWIAGMGVRDMEKYGRDMMRILTAAETGKGLDDPFTFGGRTQSARSWLLEMQKNNVLKGGFFSSLARQTGSTRIGEPRVTKGDIVSFIPPTLTGVPIPTLRRGVEEAIPRNMKELGSAAMKGLEESGHLRAGRLAAGLVEGQPRGAVYLWQLDRGVTPEQAMAKVAGTLFEFGELPVRGQKLRDIAPFLGWTWKEFPFTYAHMIKNPGAVALPARIKRAGEEMTGAGPNYSEFAADMDLFPVQQKPDGKTVMLPLGRIFPQMEGGRFFPTPSGVGETIPSRIGKGIGKGALSLLGPGEQIAMRQGLGMDRFGKPTKGTPSTPQRLGPFIVRPMAKDVLSVMRSLNEFNYLFFPERPTTLRRRLMRAGTGITPYDIDQNAERRKRLVGERRTISEERGGMRTEDEALKEARRQQILEYIRQLQEEQAVTQ